MNKLTKLSVGTVAIAAAVLVFALAPALAETPPPPSVLPSISGVSNLSLKSLQSVTVNWAFANLTPTSTYDVSCIASVSPEIQARINALTAELADERWKEANVCNDYSLQINNPWVWWSACQGHRTRISQIQVELGTLQNTQCGSCSSMNHSYTVSSTGVGTGSDYFVPVSYCTYNFKIVGKTVMFAYVGYFTATATLAVTQP